MRPTKQVHFPSTGETVDVPEWKTMDRWYIIPSRLPLPLPLIVIIFSPGVRLHMDCNPPTGQYDIAGYQDHPPININFYETMFCQSLMALTDARVPITSSLLAVFPPSSSRLAEAKLLNCNPFLVFSSMPHEHELL